MQKWQPTNSENCQFSNYQKNREKGWREGGNCQRQTSVWRKKKPKKIDIFYVFFFFQVQLAGTHTTSILEFFFSHQMNFYSVGILQHKEWAVDP